MPRRAALPLDDELLEFKDAAAILKVPARKFLERYARRFPTILAGCVRIQPRRGGRIRWRVLKSALIAHMHQDLKQGHYHGEGGDDPELLARVLTLRERAARKAAVADGSAA